MQPLEFMQKFANNVLIVSFSLLFLAEWLVEVLMNAVRASVTTADDCYQWFQEFVVTDKYTIPKPYCIYL